MANFYHNRDPFTGICTHMPVDITCYRHDVAHSGCRNAEPWMASAPCTCHPDRIQAREKKDETWRFCQLHHPQPYYLGITPRRHIMPHCSCPASEIAIRRHWILDLREGDPVIVMDSQARTLASGVATTVHRVIKKGLCVVNGIELPLPVIVIKRDEELYYFAENGMRYHPEAPMQSLNYLVQPIQEVLDKSKRAYLKSYFNKLDWDTVDMKRVNKLHEAVKS